MSRGNIKNTNNISLFYLVFTFPEHLLFAQVVDAKQFTDADENPALKGADGAGNVIHRCLVQQLQLVVVDLVAVNGAPRVGARVEDQVFAGAHQHKLLLSVTSEFAHCDATRNEEMSMSCITTTRGA